MFARSAGLPADFQRNVLKLLKSFPRNETA
jgi:hypothetical protein